MFGIKKKQKNVRRIYLDLAKSETVKLKHGDEIEVWVNSMDLNLFKTKVESLAFQCSLQVISEPEKDENDIVFIRVRKV